MKRAAGLVCIAGAFDMSPMEVLSEEQDKQFDGQWEEYLSSLYRAARG